MQVRMKVDVSGTRDGAEWPPRGSVVDLPDDEAAHYCANGMAEPVAVFGAAAAETATPAPVDEQRGPVTRRRAAALSKQTDAG
jgi:hypothetical protein